MSKRPEMSFRYIQQFDWSKIADDLFQAGLYFCFILFYIVKKILHLSVTDHSLLSIQAGRSQTEKLLPV